MNPYIPLNDYTPDGEPHVFGDRVYLYSSHDKERGTTFCMLDYVVYSADIHHLDTWTNAGIAYSVKQDPQYKEGMNHAMYAPDCVKGNDGRYYLYYCLSGDKGATGYSFPISVAVSDYPDHGFEFYGFVKNKDGSIFAGKYINFDPALMNDNGVIRIYFGAYYPWKMYHLPKGMIKKINVRVFGMENPFTGAFNTTLADDMLTINSEIHETITEAQEIGEFRKHPFFEASSIRKVKDTYYFIYSSWYNHELCYATSKNPITGFEYKGVIVSNGDIGINGKTIKKPACPIGNNHGSFEKVGDDYYIFYHRQTHDTSYSRQACVEKIKINEDGTIPQVEITSLGFDPMLKDEGTYEAARYCMLTNGRAKLIRNGKGMGKHPYLYSDENGSFIHAVDNKTVIGYKYFEFTGSEKLCMTVRGHAKGKMEVYADSNLLTTIPVSIDSDEYLTLTGAYSQNQEKTAIYFRYKGKGTFDWKDFSFKK